MCTICLVVDLDMDENETDEEIYQEYKLTGTQ